MFPCPLRSFRRLSMAALFLSLAATLCAQTETQTQQQLYQFYGGYSFLSNCPNGTPGARHALNGWNGSLAMLDWHHLRFKIDADGYSGTNLGAGQHLMVITAGGQYGRKFGPEYAFVEGLMGDASLNHHWGDNQATGQTASFATLVGGGFDTPLRRRLSLRVLADFQYMNFNADILSVPSTTPIYPSPVHHLPNFFGRVGAGLAWSF